jgi:hypothetical protein
VILQYIAKTNTTQQYWPGSGNIIVVPMSAILTSETYRVSSKTRIVDATFMKVKVPSIGPPAYEVASNVQLVTPNDLPRLGRHYNHYSVVGAGKTGIDACLWLLANEIDPAHITWIIPRDSFYLERGCLQPGPLFAETTQASLKAVNGCIMTPSSVDDLMDRLVACQQLLRLDEVVRASMFRCATVSHAGFQQPKRIQSVIRFGRIVSIEQQQVKLQHGSYMPQPDTLFIDCSADALARLRPVPVFQGKLITLQAVRYCQQVFSSALIAHIEAT